MADVKNKPYSTMSYAPNQYNEVSYESAQYSGSAYEPSGPTKENLIGKINLKDATVGIVGLGYVGLPLAVTFAEAGFRVIGLDTNKEVIAAINQGRSHVSDITSERLGALTAAGRLSASSDYAALAEADCISICVPTPLTKSKEPDISYITRSLDMLFPNLGPRKLIVLESTTYPGTTEELIAARIEPELKLTVGRDIFVAFSPERMDPGNTSWVTKNTPKVIGGVTDACTEVARALYRAALDKVHAVRSAREAETVKLLENTFRAVNIGLVNEFMLMCDRLNIDIWRVIEAASTKPFGYMPFYPGPGIGGHCISIDPLYMSWKAKAVDFHNRFIELATDINGNMPRFVIAKLTEMLNAHERAVKNAKVLILGLAYKKNVNDTRESPGLDVYRLLREKGADVVYNDPFVETFPSEWGEQVASFDISGEALADFDIMVLVTDHDAYDYKRLAASGKPILDCRNAFGTRGIEQENIVKL